MAAGTQRLSELLARVVAVRPAEIRALLWSFTYFFALLSSYYVLRPLREAMGLVGGVSNLQWLFTGTFVLTLAVVPLYGALVARLPRSRFIPLAYRFLIANLAVFWLLITFDIAPVVVSRLFFMWITVYSVFAVSVFWSFMADLHSTEQSKRLFGFIAAGGSLGVLVGPSLTALLVVPMGTANLLIVVALLLELSVFAAARVERAVTDRPLRTSLPPKDEALGGGWLDGLRLLARSPYLLSIAGWVSFLSLVQAFLYFQQADIVSAASSDTAERTRIFALIELAVGIVTVVTQIFVTGRLVTRFGAGPAAAFLPLVFFGGFIALALLPVLAVVMACQAAQRTANFALANPARETWFTVVAREEKYKAKSVIDIVVFRAADAASGWIVSGLRALFDQTGMSIAALPLCAGWIILSLMLGRAQERRVQARVPSDSEPMALQKGP